MHTHRRRPRRWLLALLAALAMLAAACAEEPTASEPADGSADDEATTEGEETEGEQTEGQGTTAGDYEVWALDQGEDINQLVIYSSDLEVVDRIDLGTLEADDGTPLVTTPHMIDFDSEFRYAFIASTASGNVTVVRTSDREVIDIIPTGAGAHMAAVTPDDSAVWVANIGAGAFNEIAIDLDAETFELTGRELIVKDDPLYDDADFPTEFAGPVCHQYSPDGTRAWLTLGPGTGGLAVVDLETATLERIWPQEEIKANCGVALTSDGSTAYANWGVPSQDEGELYVFDAQTLELTDTIPTRGIDAHGVRLTPDESELWLVNRDSSNGVVLDTSTNEVTRDLETASVGLVPDILDFSPDGDRVFITLRGPEPVTGAHATEGETPGIAVVDTATGEQVVVLEPNAGERSSDFHGIGVRHIRDDVTAQVPATRTTWGADVTRYSAAGAGICHLPV